MLPNDVPSVASREPLSGEVILLQDILNFGLPVTFTRNQDNAMDI
jgi:hypothetical protein